MQHGFAYWLEEANARFEVFTTVKIQAE